MIRFIQYRRLADSTRRIFFSGSVFLSVLAGCAISPFSLASPTSQARPVRPANAAKPDAESLLLDVYKELSLNHLKIAQAKADALVLAYPNFRLGHLIRGDLLLMHAGPVSTFGAAPGAPADKLKDLREEAIVRLKSLRERPDPQLMPRAVLQLRDDQRYVLLVDAKRSRLYVYRNVQGQPAFLADYYITQGKLGINKLKEGDQKTPIGVYYINGRVTGQRLPDFYGSGALSINYPNEWDRVNGRSGSGIWLHGTSSDNFSRPPLASDGCVVLTNPDLRKVYSSVDVGKTPVVIADQVDFVSPAKWNAERGAAMGLLENWRHDVESMDAAKLTGHYSTHFRGSTGEDLNAWLAKQPHFDPAQVHMKIELKNVSQFFYPGRNDLIVSTFNQDTRIGRSHNSLRKRQYWIKEGAQWKIIYEGAV